MIKWLLPLITFYVSAVETNKVQRLPMCLKTPLKEEAFELREHSFEVVFDVLKMCAVAARLGQQMVANGSSKGARGQTEEEVIFNAILK